ncbi:WD repeat-containing protein 87-like [Zingiber officinale]|uniref:WD repeat-containing protein 87-like n=1 Tax=Zingiber officinale TaxID=94328 RepID=UPI001C4CBD71|nr:WD repeat-containing protein 87-like [Zingiber officinale]
MDASINPPPPTHTRIHSILRFPWLRRSSTKKASSMRERSFARSPSTRARKKERKSSPEEAEEQESIDGSGAKTTPSSSAVVPKLENEELQGIDKGGPTLREAREAERTYTGIDRKKEMQKEQGQEISDGKSARITSFPPLLVPELANKELGENVKEEPTTMLVREGQKKEKVKIIPPMPMPEVRHAQEESIKEEEEEKLEVSDHESAKTTSSPLPVTKQANEESRLGGIGKVEPIMQETREVLERKPDSLPETKQGQMESREKVQKVSDSDSSKITSSHHLLVPNLAEEESDLGGMSKKKTPIMEVTEGQESGTIKEEKILSPSMPEIAESQTERRQKQQEQEISGHKRAKITPDLPIPMMENKESELVETNKEEPTNMEAMHEEEKYTSKRTVELIPPLMPETEKRQTESNQKEHGVYETEKEEVETMETKMQVPGIDRSNLENDNLVQEKKTEEDIQEREQLLIATRISARSDPTSANAAIRAGVAPSGNIRGTLPSSSTMSVPTNEESSNETTSLEKKSPLLMPQLQKTQSKIEESMTREEQGRSAELSNCEKKKTLMPSPLMPIPENTDLSHKTEVSSSISSVEKGEKTVSGDAMLFESEQVGEADMSCKASAEKIVQSSSSMLTPTSSKSLAGERNSKDPNSCITREEHSMTKMELERASILKINSESNKELKALDKPVKDSHGSNSGMDNIASISRLPALSKEEIQIDRKRLRGMVITEENEKIINERNSMNMENNDKREASDANISGTYSPSSILAPTMRDGEDEGNKPFSTAESKSIDEDAGHTNKEVKSQGRDKGESTSNGRSAWTTIGVIAMMAGITWLGQMVLMKRLEKVRRQKHT